MTETLTSLGLQLIDSQLKTLNMLIDMGEKDKQKAIKYKAAARENSATKMYNLVKAITGGRIIDDESRGFKTAKQAPKYHSGSVQQKRDKIRQSYELMGVFS